MRDHSPRILFVFAHPDDESFITGGTIAKYAHGNQAEVSLYTLTRGEASRNSAFLGISPEEIATRRANEVENAARILGVKNLILGKYPDGKLRDLDPRILEQDIERVMLSIEPNVLVTFDVQGGSVHPDHIVLHHVVKRLFVVLRETKPTLQRLCFTGLPTSLTARWPRRTFGLPDDRIHAEIDVTGYGEIERAAVLAHESVRRDVEEYNFDGWMFWDKEYFTFFQESWSPPVTDLLYGLDL